MVPCPDFTDFVPGDVKLTLTMETFPTILTQELCLPPHHLHKYLFICVTGVQDNPQLLETVFGVSIVGKP